MSKTKRTLVGIVVLSLAILFFMPARSWAYTAYTPPPGVLSPDEVDFGGETVTIVSWEDQTLRMRFEPEAHVDELGPGGEAPGLIELAEELYHVNIEFFDIPFGNYIDEYMTRLMLGDSNWDIWWIQQRHFWNIVAEMAFYPLSNILPDSYYESLPPMPASVIESMTYRGDTYPFGNDYGSVHVLRYIVWNKELFEREGLPNLYELYEAGEWNWETMTEIAIAATKDTTGDGELNQWGLAGEGMWSSPLGPIDLALSNDARVTRATEEGGREFTFDEEPAIAALEQLYEWHNVDQVIGGSFVRDEAAMTAAGAYALRHPADELGDEYSIVPYPLGPHADDHRYPAEALSTFALPSSVREPEKLVSLYHFLWPKEEYHEVFEERMYWRVRDRESVEVYTRGHEEWAGEAFHLDFVLGPTWAGTPFMNAVWDAVWGHRTAAGAMAEVKPEIQVLLDEMFDY